MGSFSSKAPDAGYEVDTSKPIDSISKLFMAGHRTHGLFLKVVKDLARDSGGCFQIDGVC